MNTNGFAKRMDDLERRLNPRPPGVAFVHCGIGEEWDELGTDEQERRIAAHLGRPSRDDDLVIVLDLVPSGTEEGIR